MPEFSANLLLYLVIAYLAGSVPTAVWVSKLFFKSDIREFGSGNAGATNTLRVHGPKAAIPVLLIDILKGVAAVLLAHIIINEALPHQHILTIKLLLGLAAITGHIFPVFAGFKGGKGVATFLGILIAINPLTAIICMLIFTAILLIAKFVSLGSLMAAAVFPLLVWLFYPSAEFSHIFLATLYLLIVIITHRANIKRLINGTENKFSIRKK